ncbi:MAG: CHAT domain-containing tetratricopeptide repeat protein [Bacteroidota bacterium]
MRCFTFLLLLLPFVFSAQTKKVDTLIQQLNKYDFSNIEQAIQNLDLTTAEKTLLQAKYRQAKGKYAQAEPLFEVAAAQAAADEASMIRFRSLNYQVLNNIEMRQLSKADSLIVVIKNGDRRSDRLFYHEALLFQSIDRYEDAIKYFEGVSNWTNNLLLDIQCAYHIGELKFEQGNFAAADSILKAVSDQISEELDPNHIENAFVWNHLGRLYSAQGKYEVAKNYYEGAMCSFKEKVGDQHIFYGRVLYNLGALHTATGEYAEAETLLLEAQKIYRASFGDSPAYATVLGGLEELYQKLGQTKKELAFGLEQQTIYLNSSKLVDYARVTNNIAYTYQALDSLELANRMLQGAIHKLENASLTDDKIYALLHMNFAGLNTDLGNFEMAKVSFELSKNRLAELYGIYHPWYATVINNLASLYEETSDYEAAKTLYLETETIDSTTLGTRHPYYIGTLYNLANIHQQTEEYATAHTYFQRANEGQINLIYNYYSGFDEATRLDYLKQTQVDFDRFFSFVAAHHTRFPSLVIEMQNISLATKNLALDFSVDQQAMANKLEDEKDLKTYRHWRTIKDQLAKYYIESVGEQQAKNIDLKALEAEAELLEKELIRNEALSSLQLNQQTQKTWEDIRDKVKKDEAVIDFVRFRRYQGGKKSTDAFYAAIVTRKNYEAPKLIIGAREAHFKRMLRPNVRAGGGNYIENPKITADLYKSFWRFIEEELEGVKHIHLSATGLLHKVAFNALTKDNEYLLHQYNFIYYSNLRSFLEEKQEKAATNNSIFLMGGAIFDLDSIQRRKIVQKVDNQSLTEVENTIVETKTSSADSTRSAIVFDYLPGTVQEVQSIEQQFQNANWQTTAKLGAAALEEQFKQLEQQKSPTILHLATHGYFFGQPKKDKQVPENARGRIMETENPLIRSGLALTGANHAWKEGKKAEGLEDGILTAYEIANLQLPETKLVVLSACETALGDVVNGEGVFGLQRAFKLAGVDEMLISLWKVPDAETAQLMQHFYTFYLQNNNASEALHQAQLEMAKQYRSFYWAGFVLVK